jgi:hypothetical protein
MNIDTIEVGMIIENSILKKIGLMFVMKNVDLENLDVAILDVA